MISFHIDQETNDLALDDSFALRTVSGADAVSQHARQRIMTHQGEWFLDTRAGIDWFGRAVGRPYAPEVLEAIVTAEIATTDGVREVEALSVSFNNQTRSAVVKDFSIATDYDEDD